MKIGFATDTNFLRGRSDFLNIKENFLNYSDYFINYIKSLEKTGITDKLIYYMPNIVIEELYNQKIVAFNKRYNSFKKTYKDIQFALEGNIPSVKIESFLGEKVDEFKEKVKILELPYTEKLFKELVEDSLKKIPPFDKTIDGQKTDAGFKDALIWKTILYSDCIDECKKFYFFTADKVFEEGKEILFTEFKKIHPNIEFKIVYFEPNGKQREFALEQIISENNLIRTNLVMLYNDTLILDNIKKLKYKYYKEVFYKYSENANYQLKEIEFDKFLNEDFSIEDVSEENGEYRVVLNIKTKKYILTEEIEKNNYVTANITLIFNKSSNQFILKDYELRNVRFNFSFDINKIMPELIEYKYKIDISSLQNSLKQFADTLRKLSENYNLNRENNEEDEDKDDNDDNDDNDK